MSTVISNKDASPISEESDMFLSIRKNWCCILEEIIECPICMDIPLSNVYQCTKGHNICDICQKLVINCPICGERYAGTRNRCVEDIIKKLSDVKLLLLDPSSEIEKCSRIEKKSEGTQTVQVPMTEKGTDPICNETAKLERQKRIKRRKTQ